MAKKDSDIRNPENLAQEMGSLIPEICQLSSMCQIWVPRYYGWTWPNICQTGIPRSCRWTWPIWTKQNYRIRTPDLGPTVIGGSGSVGLISAHSASHRRWLWGQIWIGQTLSPFSILTQSQKGPYPLCCGVEPRANSGAKVSGYILLYPPTHPPPRSHHQSPSLNPFRDLWNL